MSETLVQGEEIVVNINRIKPYWRNPRVNEHNVDAIAESIKTYGYNQYIVVDSDLVIVAGHTRFKALKRLGFEEIKVTVRDFPPPLAKQYRIIDNKSAENSAWDDRLLIQELRETELPAMEIFFAGVDLDELIKESVGTTGWTEITDEKFDQAVISEAGKIEVLVERRNSEETLVMCPHCGGEFSVV